MLAYSDTGDDQRALSLAETAVGRDTPDLTARSMYLWSLAEVHFQMSNVDNAAAVAQACVEVPLPGFPGFTNGAVIGAWCRMPRRAGHGCRRGPGPLPVHQPRRRAPRVRGDRRARARRERPGRAHLRGGGRELASDVPTIGAAVRDRGGRGRAPRRSARPARRLLTAVAAEARAIGALRHLGWAQRAFGEPARPRTSSPATVPDGRAGRPA